MTNTMDAWLAGATATMNVTYTQANAAGGAVVCEISPGTGNEFILSTVKAINSGTNGIIILLEGAAGGTNMITLDNVASGAGTSVNLGPGTFSNTLTTANLAGLGYPFIVSGSQALRVQQSAAGAQNDTFQVLINIRCKGAVPTVIHSNSVNPANVSVTAGAESFAVI